MSLTWRLPSIFSRFRQRRIFDRALAKVTTIVFGDRVDGALSERVRRSIARQQAASEVVVGWTQASAIVFFAVIYSISPKAFPPDTQFEPVPWTLGIYAVFTAVRIFLAYRRKLGDRFVALSIVVDITVLMITIWSFHLQYHAPPALYLKAPTLMYVFILIALRTLRFEPRYVLIAGACAAMGWLGLFLYAASGSSGTTPAFTHSYVDYVTSYKILRGAEIDKILSILVVTAILALSLVRARRLLVSSIAEEVAAHDLSRFFAPEIAAQIRRTEFDPLAGQGVRRDAAILIIDLRGFTKLSHDSPAKELIALLGEYQSRLVPVIQKHHGSIDKYIGDGILASFGAVVPSATYAADVCRAIEDLATVARTWRRERQTRGLPAPTLGIAGAVGEVVFGTVGHETRLEYTVVGEVVNLVAKLEKHTKVEKALALTTRDAYRLAIAQGFRPQGPTEDRPRRLVEGLAEPADLVTISG